jgi:hypothetical protein
MIHKFRTVLAGVILSCGFVSFLAAVPTTIDAQAAVKNNLCGGVELSVAGGSCAARTAGGGCANAAGAVDSSQCASADSINKVISNIINVLSIIVGIVAVIMIILGGFKYITSGGDSGSISSAKTTIIYAIVGLVIVALAQVIVKFVLSKATA